MKGAPSRLTAYIDETGDRGSSAASSPIFGMAGLVVDHIGERDARSALQTLRSDFGVPSSRAMSWKHDLTTHARRRHASRTLAGVSADHLKVSLVVCRKADVAASAGYARDVTVFYNYTAGLLYERLLYSAAEWPGGGRVVDMRFGHVKKHDHSSTLDYFDFKGSYGRWRLPTQYAGHVTFVRADQYEMSQVADLYAGFLKAAVWPDEWRNVEGAYLRDVWHQLRASHHCTMGRGLKSMTGHDVFKNQEWWPCTC